MTKGDLYKMNTKNTEQFMTKNLTVWFGALICCALWGSAFPCIKLGYNMTHIAAHDTYTQILYAGCRFFLAGVLTILIGSLMQKKFLKPRMTQWKNIAWLSMLQTILQYIFFYIGLAHTSGVKASIIEGVNVFFAILVAGLLFHQEKVTSRKLIGCLIGFSGVVLVNLSGGKIDTSLSFYGEGFIVLSTIAYAFSSVYIKKYSKEHNPVLLSGYQFLFGGFVMAVCGFLAGGRIKVFSISAMFMLLYLALISAVAYSLWAVLLKYNPVSKVAVFGFMNPVFGVILSALLLNEKNTLGISSVAALVLVSIGIYIVNKSKP